MSKDDCIFCKIGSGEIPVESVAKSEHCIAFRDIAPKQPVHILVIPKKHYENISELVANDTAVLVDLMQLGTRVAANYSNGSFRFTFNTGAQAGQTIFHAHGHITSRTPIGSSSANEGDFAK